MVIGGGGREHAIVHALSRSSVIGKLHCAPGNPGIAELAELHGAHPCDSEAIKKICADRGIGFAVIGPDDPLAAGVADALRGAGLIVFGPGAAGAKLESSKAFAKRFMARHNIPTARFDICADLDECANALASRKPPYVIKADGLSLGKGVFLPHDIDEAKNICRGLLSGERLGDAGRVIVIEDFMRGSELSVFAITDGKSFCLLKPSRDHKRVFEGDEGPNTGGMGAYSPVKLPAGTMNRVVSEILRPTLKGLQNENIDYRGVIYMGLMLTEDGVYAVEYNARFGDPETQAVLPIFGGDIGDVLLSCAKGSLGAYASDEPTGGGAAFCVVLASGGYPGSFERGLPIEGLGSDYDIPGTFIYHAGTKRGTDSKIITSGGRVLSVVGTGETFADAKRLAYERAVRVKFDNMHYRKDIGRSEE